MDKKFIDAINANDFIALRDMLRNRLLMDHDVIGGAFRDCWTVCEKAGITQNIFQRHDGRDIPNTLTVNNYNSLVGQLATNFSELRLNAILNLAKKLWPNEQSAEKTVDSETITTSSNNAKFNKDEEGRIVSQMIINEREIPHVNPHNSSSRINNTTKSDLDLKVVVAIAAVAAAAVIAGVVIFG